MKNGTKLIACLICMVMSCQMFGQMKVYNNGSVADVITGVVSRITAPNFEQNVSDSRFAIVTEGETYYVMVNGYWPNPNEDALIVYYDTIPTTNEIEAEGTVMTFVDEAGESFNVIDIQQLNNAKYSFGTGYIDWSGQYAAVNCNVPPFNICYLAINGELQTEYPIMFNGMPLDDGLFTMVGIAETWPDYDLPVLELATAMPYAIETTVTGVVEANEELCLTTTSVERHYLSWTDDSGTHYLTNNDQLFEDDFFSAAFGDEISSTISGFSNVHYDLFGSPFQTFETITLESVGERSLVGPIIAVGSPSVGYFPPIGMTCSIVQDGDCYLVDNPQIWDYSETQCIIDNDTLPYYMEVTGIYSTATLFLDNNLKLYMSVFLDDIELNRFETETIHGTLTSQTIPYFPNPVLSIVVDENEVYYIGSMSFEDASSGCFTFGTSTIYLGDSFTATGEMAKFYDLQSSYPKYSFDIYNTIDITEVGDITGLSNLTSTDINVYPNPTCGIVEIVSDKQIRSVIVYDNVGKMILEKSIQAQKTTLDLTDCKGLVYIDVIFEDGHKITEKEIIR